MRKYFDKKKMNRIYMKFKFYKQEFKGWVLFAIMFFVVFGYAAKSLFWLYRIENRYPNITYNPNQKDKSESYPGKQDVNTTLPANTADFDRISKDLGQAENLIKTGENEKSLTILKKSENTAFAHAANKSDPFQVKFETIGNEIIFVEKNLQQGKREVAIQTIEKLTKQIKTML